MTEIALRQIRAIIAVREEGSFTRAALRENATQSGISQHVATAERALGSQMKATGEVMAIDRTFGSALNKALRGLEQAGAGFHSRGAQPNRVLYMGNILQLSLKLKQL